MQVFNLNDYKEKTEIDLDELDDRYVNTEGDTMEHLNTKSIQLFDNSTLSFADNTIQLTAFNDDAKNEIYENVSNMIQNISGSNNDTDSSFSGVKTFNDDVIFKYEVKIYDVNNSGDYTSLYQNNNVFNVQNISNSGTIDFLIGSQKMAQINQWQLNMLNKPIKGVPMIGFIDGTNQTTAFTTSMTDTLQTQINALDFKTKSFTYLEIPEIPNVTPYYEKMTFDTDNVEFKGYVNLSGGSNVSTQITNASNRTTAVENRATALEYKTNGMDQYAWSSDIRFSKKIVITAPMGAGGSGAHITLSNNHPTWVDAGSSCTAMWFAGCPAGYWSSMTKNKDTVYLNQEPSFGVNNATGGFVFTTHANIKRGLRIDCAGGKSELHCGEFEVNANLKVNGTTTLSGDISAGSITLAGTDLQTTLDSKIGSTLTENLNCNGFDVQAAANLTGSTINATTTLLVQGTNVRGTLNSHSSSITALQGAQNKLTADLNCQNKGITFLRDITFNNYGNITNSTSNMMLYPGASKNIVLRNGQGSVPKDLTISFDSVDFGGRTLLNTSGGGSQYGDFPDVYVTSTTSFTVISCSTISQGSNIADVSSGHISFNATGVYRVTIGFSTGATQGNSGGELDLYIRTRSQTGQPSPALQSMYSSSFTGNANTSNTYASDYIENDKNPMILDNNDFYEFRCRNRRYSNNDAVRPNRFSLCYTAHFTQSQELRLTMKGSYDWTLSGCRYLIERIA